VDPAASPVTPQLIYELLFGRPEHFRAPFFPQPLYQLHLAAPVNPQVIRGAENAMKICKLVSMIFLKK
jgi:hypothetical protein